MSLTTVNTDHTLQRTKHNLDRLLPELVRRIRSAEFSSQNEIAAAYGVTKSTVADWKRIAIERNLIDPVSWFVGLHSAKLRQPGLSVAAA